MNFTLTTMMHQKFSLTKNKSSSLQHLRTTLGLILAGYCLVGIASDLKLKKEIFPLYSWFLFSRVPNATSKFNLILHEYNGQKLNPPKPFHQTPKAIANSGAITATYLINNIGKNYLQGNKNEVRKLRNLLENNFLKGSVKYELVLESYDPLEKWKTGKVETKSLEFFQTGDLK